MRTYVLALDYIITPIGLNVNRGFCCCRRIPTANGSFSEFCRVARKNAFRFGGFHSFLHYSENAKITRLNSSFHRAGMPLK